jgi:Dyp-type peroxidase family
MAVTLDKSISWKNPLPDDRTMLDNLQANIIKGHTRDFLTLLFLSFGDAKSGRDFVRALSPLVKSAQQHLDEIQNFKDNDVPGTPYVGVGLTAAGYERLGFLTLPNDPSFLAGMQKTKDLNDPPVNTWDQHFQQPGDLHAVVLVGDMLNDTKVQAHETVVALINAAPGVTILGAQDGHGQHNANGEGIEHFGYVDGRSQPLFLTEDIEDERSGNDGTHVWKPGFPLQQVIVGDAASSDKAAFFGSYFIFRKLEQNVKLFKEEEERFAGDLAREGARLTPKKKELQNEEIAGAFIVGRFEDGTPVVVQAEDGVESPVLNNFNYGSDIGDGVTDLALKCPHFAHIRKTNPRGSGGFGQLESVERTHLMARRGQTYGVRVDNPNDGKTTNKPEKDVGLLFMAFNSDIGNQFEFTQIKWANSTRFPQTNDGAQPGVDPVIGQLPPGTVRANVDCPVIWGDTTSIVNVAQVAQAVTMKGGEYFFMPSLEFLASV